MHLSPRLRRRLPYGDDTFLVSAARDLVDRRQAAVYRLADGKVVEHRAEMDVMGLMQQLGAVPSSGQAPTAAAT